MEFTLCSRHEIGDPGSRGFEIDIDDETRTLFVVHRFGEFHAYINSCPHTGANLEWLENQFLDRDNDFIQCATHDALFEIESGLCVRGPCTGASLTALPLSIRDDAIIVELT